ncbi:MULTISPECIES: hypothetical protein [unclassified Clostridium]|uniref:hypothetical protein n=1 Tax=unclassified Clostridium TaxID=2614128 RepID=UPI000297F78E|nr:MULTISPECIES: hypothetical protein [unclassified Clostridium]EKQ58195.1 MAG: hypothetical protein A370_00050 [Clostridium sp. Maddingley MBC34-26]
MRKEGSILIEVIASLMILSLTTIFIVSASIQNSRILKERILSEEVNRDVCNLINELKYNVTRKEIDDMLIDEKIGFKYDQDFSKNLLNSGIVNLGKGEDIEICKISEDEMGLKLKVIANIKDEVSEVNLEKEFTKSWWMDEA